MAPAAGQVGSQRWRGAHHILCDAPAWAAHGRPGLVLSCSSHAYEPGDAASSVAKCTMDRRMQEVIPGARVCSVLSQKGTACAGLRLELLDIRTIAGRCMVGCLRMIMVHIIGGLSVRVLEDVREVALFVRRSQQHIRHWPSLEVGFTRCSPTRCCRTCNAGSSFSSQQEQQRGSRTNSCMADVVETYTSQNDAFASCSR